MSDTLRSIPIDAVDLTDERYRIFLNRPDFSFLTQSIAATGVLTPPVLKPVADRYLIVSGFNRLHALKEAGLSLFHGLVLPKEMPEEKVLERAICLAAFSTPLSHAETALSIRRLSSHYDLQWIAQNSGRIFNQILNKKMVSDLAQITTLPEKALHLLHHGRIALKTAVTIASKTPDTADRLVDFFAGVKASSGKQNQILSLMNDLAHNKDAAYPEILNDPKIQSIGSNADMPDNVKADEIRRILTEKRYPAVSKTQEDFRSSVANLKLSRQVNVRESDHFESSDIHFSFKARSREEFSSVVHRLNQTLENNTIDRIFMP